MKKLQTLCGAVVLALALVVPASAGDMSTWITSPPPSSPATTDGDISTPAPTTDGNMSTGVASQSGSGSGEASASDAVAGLALNLLQSVLSLV
jgi:hypothetical protein